MEDKISEDPIDAVITWVDGNDKQWQEKINKYSKVKINFSEKDQLVRFNSIGEIDVAVKSIIKFAPFIRTIFIVTDNQTPDSFQSLQQLAQEKGINLKIIDHKVIFKGYEDCLPTFNSISIGNMIFKIPDLSEYFVYFNDDVFLMRDVKPTDFFINGSPVIRGKWEAFYENRTFRNIFNSFRSLIRKPRRRKASGFKQVQQNSAKLAGTSRYVRRFHTPVSIKKSTLDNFFAENSEILRENVKHPFRDKTQFIISSLSEHLEIKNKTYYFQRDTQLSYFRTYKHIFLVKLKLFMFLKNEKKLFATFQSLELASNEIQAYIFKWLNKRLS